MAIAITNLRGNCIMIARDIDELNWVYPSHGLYDNVAGKKHTITEAEFTQLQLREKFLKYDGTTISYEDHNFEMSDEVNMLAHIEHQKNLLKGKIENKSDHALKAAAETYLTALENIDISSFSYPFTTTLEKHMSDQGHTVVSSLQIY